MCKHDIARGLLLATLLVPGCGGDEVTNPPPLTGTVVVSASSIGSAVDADGYVVTLGGMPAVAVGANGSVAIDLAVGDYEVGLSGLVDNCGVIGANSVNVVVVEADTADVEFQISCPPYHNYIAFSSTRGDSSRIFVMEADGSNPTALTAGMVLLDSYPAWSPDATQIAFTGVSGRLSQNNIFVLNTASMSVRQLTTGGHVQLCDWSPDGSQIAHDFFQDCPDSVTCGDIYVVNADGSSPVNLTPGPASSSEPAWSPDGDRIAFRRETADVPNIWIMQSDGSVPIQLTYFRHGPVWEPAWSPDGTRIAFTGPGEQAETRIWVVHADGSNLTGLTSDLTEYQAWRPSWSPDGSRIAYWAYLPDDGYCYQIYVVDADGSNPTNLTNHQSCNTGPDWSAGQ